MHTTRIRLLVSILLVVLGIHPVHAQTTSLRVSPAILESIVRPGEEIKTDVVITNQTNAPLPIKGYIRNFQTNEELETSQSEAYDASAWFSLDPADYILQPREERKITVKIAAPQGVEPGGHYATIYFEPLLPQGIISSQGPVTLARVGVLAFLVAPGDIKEGLKTGTMSFPSWSRRGPITGTVRLTNTGNLHIIPSATYTITDMWGQEETITPETVTIMPGTSRDHAITWNKNLGFGKFSIKGTYIFGAEKQKINTESVIFYLIPWHVFLLVGIPLTTLLYFVIVGRKRISKAWSVLTGKADTWQPQSATSITLEDLQKEKNNELPKPKKTKKTSRPRARRKS